MRTRSSSFLVQVAPQSVPGHPEAKSGQNLIRNGLLEAILEASRPASKPASQAQPLGRVFSTKRTRGQDRRVFSGQKPVQSKKHRCARSSSSFFVQKHVQSKKLEVIRSGSSFFGQKPVQSKKLRCARSSSRFFVKKVIQSKKLEGDPFKLEFFRLNAPEDGIVEFFRPDWLPKGPRTP